MLMKMHGMDFATRAPTAHSQTVTAQPGTETTITLTGADPDGDDLSFAILDGPDKGTLLRPTLDNAIYNYTPHGGATGQDEFVFRASDGHIRSGNATVTINIAPVGTITFTADLRSLSQIDLDFSERIAKRFISSDFTLSTGTINSVSRGTSDSRVLGVADIPYGANVVVTYVGATYSLGSGQSELVSGTTATATGIPRPTTTTTFTHNFQSGTSSLTHAGDDEWETNRPHMVLPGQQSGNKVLTSNDCDTQCIVMLDSGLDTSSPLTIEFDRFVDRRIDRGEGMFVQYSTDGSTWSTLASYTHNNRQDTDRWEDASLTLDITPNSVSLRFVAESNRSDEYVEIDNLSISPKVTDTTRPTITAPSDRTFEATGVRTMLTAMQIGTEDVDVNDAIDPNPAVTNNAPPDGFPVGPTIVTWTARDSAGNTATDTQTITVRDTTPPDITVPDDASFTTTGASATLTSLNYSTATAMDLADPSPVITSNATNPFRIGDTVIAWTATDNSTNSATAHQTVTVIYDDGAAPGVLSITRHGQSDGVLAFNVTFSEPVTGVDAGDFALSPGSPQAGAVHTRTLETAVNHHNSNQYVMEVPGTGTVSAVSASVNITHAMPSDLNVTLTSPGGITRVLHDRVNATSEAITGTYATDFAGEQFPGNWALRVVNTQNNYNGTLNYWKLIFGADPVSDVSGTGSHRIVTVPAQAGGTYNLDVVPGGITDIAGNPLSDAVPAGADESHTVNATGSATNRLEITAPPDVAAEASAEYSTVALGNASVTAGANVTITNDSPAEGLLLGSVTITWTATDAAGRASTDTQVVTVRDTTAPVIGPTQDVMVSFGSGDPLVVVYPLPSVSDTVTFRPTMSCTPSPGSTFAEGATTVTCTTADDSGNAASAEFTVTVTVHRQTAPATVAFFDDFNDGNLNGWTDASAFYSWRADTFDSLTVPPGQPASNKVAEADFCNPICILEMSTGLGIPASGTSTLQFYRYVDSLLIAGEYFRVDVNDGTGWTQLDSWTPEEFEDDDTWHLESYDLSAYAGTADFKVRFVASSSSHLKDTAVDDVKILVPTT